MILKKWIYFIYKMGLLQYIYKNEDEYRINVDEYFKSKDFTNETIRLYNIFNKK